MSAIRTLESSLGSPEKRFLPCEQPCFDKLGKSVVSTRAMRKGHRLEEARDLCIKVKEAGLSVPKKNKPCFKKEKKTKQDLKKPWYLFFFSHFLLHFVNYKS